MVVVSAADDPLAAGEVPGQLGLVFGELLGCLRCVAQCDGSGEVKVASRSIGSGGGGLLDGNVARRRAHEGSVSSWEDGYQAANMSFLLTSHARGFEVSLGCLTVVPIHYPMSHAAPPLLSAAFRCCCSA